MAFYVQTDNGVVRDANGNRVEATSYVSVEYIDEYAVNYPVHGTTQWNALSETGKQAHANNGKIYIDTRFANNLIGEKWNMQIDGDPVFRQSSAFPRINLIGRDDNDYSMIVPIPVMEANARYAIISAANPSLWIEHPSTAAGGSTGNTTINTTTNITETTIRGAIKTRSLGPLTEEYFAPGTRQSVAEYHLNNNRATSPDVYTADVHPQADSLILVFTKHDISSSQGITVGRINA